MPMNPHFSASRRTIYILLIATLGAGIGWTETIYFPRAENDAQFVTGVAFSNNQSTGTSITLTLFNGAGASIASGTFSLAGYGQIVGTIQDLLSAPNGFNGWLRADSTGSISGLGILFNKQDPFISEAPSVRVPDR